MLTGRIHSDINQIESPAYNIFSYLKIGGG